MKIEQGHIQSFFGSGTNEKLEAFKEKMAPVCLPEGLV